MAAIKPPVRSLRARYTVPTAPRPMASPSLNLMDRRSRLLPPVDALDTLPPPVLTLRVWEYRLCAPVCPPPNCSRRSAVLLESMEGNRSMMPPSLTPLSAPWLPCAPKPGGRCGARAGFTPPTGPARTMGLDKSDPRLLALLLPDRSVAPHAPSPAEYPLATRPEVT